MVGAAEEDEGHDEEPEEARGHADVGHERAEEPEDEHLEQQRQAHEEHDRAGRDEADEHGPDEEVERGDEDDREDATGEAVDLQLAGQQLGGVREPERSSH